jgi:hypothetical protein
MTNFRAPRPSFLFAEREPGPSLVPRRYREWLTALAGMNRNGDGCAYVVEADFDEDLTGCVLWLVGCVHVTLAPKKIVCPRLLLYRPET